MSKQFYYDARSGAHVYGQVQTLTPMSKNTTTKRSPSVQLLFDEASGIYIPKRFAREIKREAISGVSESDLDYLARGPGGCLDDDETLAEGETIRGEHYWEVWDDVLSNAVRVYWCAAAGQVFTLAVLAGGTCIANVQSMLSEALPCQYGLVYVIWKPKAHTAAVFNRWIKKWTARTS